jgi:hypothetical protein
MHTGYCLGAVVIGASLVFLSGFIQETAVYKVVKFADKILGKTIDFVSSVVPDRHTPNLTAFIPDISTFAATAATVMIESDRVEILPNIVLPTIINDIDHIDYFSCIS